MKLLKMPFMALLVVVLTAGFTGSASAVLIAYVDATVTEAAGEYTYSYDVYNDTDPAVYDPDDPYWPFAENIWVFTVYPEAAVFDIATPVGWTSYFTDFLTFVKWPSDDPTYDIVPGGSQDGFGFKSLVGPGTVGYDVEGSDDWGFPTGTIYASTTTGPVPAAVPEPSSMLLLGFGIVGLAGYISRKSRRV